MPKWWIETHTGLIREVNQAQIWLNLLIGLKGIKGIKYENRVSWTRCQSGQWKLILEWLEKLKKHKLNLIPNCIKGIRED